MCRLCYVIFWIHIKCEFIKILKWTKNIKTTCSTSSDPAGVADCLLKTSPLKQAVKSNTLRLCPAVDSH